MEKEFHEAVGDTLNASVEKAIQEYVAEEQESEENVHDAVKIMA